MELQDAMVAAATPIPAATGVAGGGGGLFTAAQWVELQRQALIYNHMAASAPIPSYLLFSIVSNNAPAAASYCYPYYQAAARMSMLLQCMQHAVARRRCRRTDGKKWRCARDAEPDQKYCQRHLHRAATRRSKPSAAAAPPDQNDHHQHKIKTQTHNHAAKSSNDDNTGRNKASGALLDFTGRVAGLPEQRENRLSLDYDTIAEQYHQVYCSSGAVNNQRAMDDGASSSWVGGIGGPLGEVLGLGYAAAD